MDRRLIARILVVLAPAALCACGGRVDATTHDRGAPAAGPGGPSPLGPRDVSAPDASVNPSFDASMPGPTTDQPPSPPPAPTCTSYPCQLYASNGSDLLSGIAVNSKYVYVADNSAGTVLAMPHAGGAVVTLATDSRPTRVAVNETDVYWTSQYGTVKSVSVGGGAVRTIASSQGETVGIALDRANVYWTLAGQGGSIQSAPLGGGTVTTLAPGQDDPLYLAVGSAAAYWINGDIYDPQDGGCLMTVPLDGGDPVALSPWVNLAGAAVAVDAVNVYWAESGTLSRRPLAGGQQVTLATNAGTQDIAVDATNVYWTDRATMAIMKVPIAGGSPVQAPVQVATSFELPEYLAVDATNVYWTDFAGVVMTAPK